MLTDAVRAVLESGHLAHLVTLNADGSPQVAIVWVGLDGDEIVSGHLRMQQKVRNVQRDPRVVLSMESGARNPMGLDEYVIVRGRARVTEGGAPELLQRLAHVYLGPVQSSAAWRRSATSRSRSSLPRRATSCAPTGRPSADQPAGTESDG